MSIHESARHNMVESQIRTNRVTDQSLLAALSSLPRERFVPESLSAAAYVDEDLPIGAGRFLMEPMVLSRLVQAAAVTKQDVVLDIGCGSGYSSAVLASLANTVVALESDPDLSTQAAYLLNELKIDNIAMVDGNITTGYAAQAPYDVIFVNGMIPAIPKAISDQLAEGGRLVAVVAGTSGSTGCAILMRRRNGIIAAQHIFDANIAPLEEFTKKQEFIF